MERKKIEFTLEEFSNAEHWTWEAFKLYQSAQDDADILYESGKDLLQEIMTSLDKPDEKNSEAKLERLARTSDRWKSFRVGQFAAIRLAGEYRVKYQSAVRYFDCVQSGLSYKREELKKLG